MRAGRALVTVVVATALVATSGGPSRALTLPELAEGTRWTVKSIYRQVPREKRAKNPSEATATGWTEPSFWVYTVKRVKKHPDGTLYLIQVKNKDESRPPMASLVIARYRRLEGEPETVVLSGGSFYDVARNQPTKTARKFVQPGEPGRPVMTDESIIPYDFPRFPVSDPAPGPRREVKRTFAITEEVEGLKYARDIVQTETINLPPESIGGPELRTYLEKQKLPTTGLCLVELTRAFDGARTRQIWADKVPFFLYNENPFSRSWLWEFRLPERKGGNGSGR